MANLSESQRIQILILRGFGDKERSYAQVSRLFNQLNPQKFITRSTVCKTVRRYRDSGNVKNLPKPGRPKTATGDETKLNVLLQLEENAQISTKQLALDNNIAQRSVVNIMKSEKIRPYKIKYTQELAEDDPDRRLQFCEIIEEKKNIDPNFVNKIVFSDEATFCLNGKVNRHNCRIWSRRNPHWMREVHTQRPQKINVWAGVINSHLIGPFFIYGTLNGARYLDLLRDNIVPAIAALFPNPNNPMLPSEDIWFQQDGAPPHFTQAVRHYLDTVFPQRWIGRRGAIEWPPRSPDLTPLDFFLWGYLKNRVYQDRPIDIENLRERIVTEINQMPPIYLQNSVRHVSERLGYCQIANGLHFEHLL